MTITQVTSFRFNDKLYPTELQAVRAALEEIGTRLVKDFHHDPVAGLVELGETLSYLRDRYLALTGALDAA